MFIGRYRIIQEDIRKKIINSFDICTINKEMLICVVPDGNFLYLFFLDKLIGKHNNGLWHKCYLWKERHNTLWGNRDVKYYGYIQNYTRVYQKKI